MPLPVPAGVSINATEGDTRAKISAALKGGGVGVKVGVDVDVGIDVGVDVGRGVLVGVLVDRTDVCVGGTGVLVGKTVGVVARAAWLVASMVGVGVPAQADSARQSSIKQIKQILSFIFPLRYLYQAL